MSFSISFLICIFIFFIIDLSISIDVKELQKKSSCPCDHSPIERSDLFLLNEVTKDLILCNIN
jgi:hypothetical protein